MNTRPYRTTAFHRRLRATPLLLLAVLVPFLLPSAETEPAATQVARIAEMLGEAPLAVGCAIDDRAAWDALRSLPGFSDLVERAEQEAERPLPEMTDDIFLDFSRTGNRDRGQRVISERHGRFRLLVLAECLENRGKYLPAIERALRSVCEERTWLLPAHAVESTTVTESPSWSTSSSARSIRTVVPSTAV